MRAADAKTEPRSENYRTVADIMRPVSGQAAFSVRRRRHRRIRLRRRVPVRFQGRRILRAEGGVAELSALQGASERRGAAEPARGKGSCAAEGDCAPRSLFLAFWHSMSLYLVRIEEATRMLRSPTSHARKVCYIRCVHGGHNLLVSQ